MTVAAEPQCVGAQHEGYCPTLSPTARRQKEAKGDGYVEVWGGNMRLWFVVAERIEVHMWDACRLRDADETGSAVLAWRCWWA